MKVLKIDEHEKFYEYFDVETVDKTEILSKNGEKVTAEIEIFSENGELLYEEKLPKEFTELLNHSMSVVDNKKETKNFLRKCTENQLMC